MAYSKQQWNDEIPDLTKPIKDAAGKQKTDPQTGRPLYELVQEGTRITSGRLNHIEDGIGDAHTQLTELSEDIERHASDVVKHLTAAERTAWNAKETPAAAQQKADASLASAKSYTDTQLLIKADKSTTYSKTETDQRIQAVVGAAPAALDTLKEIGDALNNDPNFAATVTNQLSGKVDKVSGKQLSTEDFTSSEKSKLAGITPGAGGAGSASDSVIGNRTISDSTAPTGDIGTITTLLGWLGNMIKSITGKSSWRTAPATTLEAAKTHADDTTRHITATERTDWNAKETTTGAQAKADGAKDAAILASVPRTQKGAAGGVAALDEYGAVVGSGLAFSTTYKQQILYFNFVNGTANQKVNLFFTNTSGFIEVTIASSFAFYNAKGRLTKRFEGSFDAVGTAHEPTSAYTEVSGNIKYQISIGDPVWDSAQSKWRVPIESRSNNGNPFVVLFTSQGATGAAVASISAVYTGAATTLPMAVQTIPDDTETRSGYKIQKHKLSENGGSNLWLAEGTDLNTVIQNGFYNGLHFVNQPVAGDMYWYIEVQRYSGHASFYVFQRAIQLNSSGYKVNTYERVQDAGVWGDWQRVLHSTDQGVAWGLPWLDGSKKVPRDQTYNSLGGVTEVANLNSATTAGVYAFVPGIPGSPGPNDYGFLEVIISNGDEHNGANWVKQVASMLSGYVFMRLKVNAGSWSEWGVTAGDAIYKTRGIVQGNYNDYVKAGTWQVFGATGNTNGPALTAPWAILEVSVGSNGYITQEVTQVTAPYGRWYRGRTETEWGQWMKVLTNQDSGSFAPAVHEHNYIKSVDRRDIKPNNLLIASLALYFTDRLGLTGNNMWTDLLVLNSYVDGSGGLINALSFNKMVTGGMRIEHVQAAPGAADWGTPKSLAYLDEVYPKTGGKLEGPIQRTFQGGVGGRDISVFRDVHAGSFAGASVTGALVIVLPGAWDSTMMNITIKGFNYWGSGAWEVTAGGYNFGDTNWYNTTARVWGNTPFTRVRFGYDTNRSKCCIILGDAGTVWAYPFFSITEVMVPGDSDWYSKGWTSYFTTDMSMLTKMNQPVINYGTTTNLLRDMAPDVLGAANTIAQRDASGNLYVNNAVYFSDNDGIVYYDDTNQMCAKIDGTVTELLHTGNTAALSTPYAVTAGTGAAYAAAFNPAVSALSVGLRVTIKAHTASTGPITISVNGLEPKAIKKPNGNNPTLTAGGVYSLVYDGSVFQLQGEGGEYGNAGAAQVLSGYTVGQEYGLVDGAMANNGSIIITPSLVDQAIPGGYHTGAGKVAANPNEPGKILAGQTYAGLSGTATSDANATASDLRSGKSAYVNGVKINGNFQPITNTVGLGMIAPSTNVFNNISFTLQINATPGMTLGALTVYAPSSTSDFVYSSLTSPKSIRLPVMASWTRGQGSISSIIGLSGDQALCSLQNVSYNASTGVISCTYRWITSGSGSLYLDGSGVSFSAQYLLY